jgi:DNA polymerase III sliding clamp (beta) subunit (PCNA family)
MKISHRYDATIACSQDSTRVLSYGAFLDTRESKLVSTNGHYMTVLPVTVEEGDTCGILRRVTLDAARAAAKVQVKAIKLPPESKRDARKAAEATRAAVTYSVPATHETMHPDSSMFPKWQNVAPGATPDKIGHERPLKLAFSAKYLAEIAEAMGTDGVVLTVETSSEKDADFAPIHVAPIMDTDGAFAILMPMRR